MSTCNTRNWKAIENRQPSTDSNPGVPFYVTGEVETTNGALQPVLRVATPQGINPGILILELTIERVSDVGTTDIKYRDVRYDTRTSQGQYKHVQVRCGLDEIAFIDVQIVS